MDKAELKRQGDILYDAEEMGLTSQGAFLIDAQRYGKDEPAARLLKDFTDLKTLEADMVKKNYKRGYIQEIKDELIEQIETRYIENVEAARQQAEKEFQNEKDKWEKDRYRDSEKLLMQDREREQEFGYVKSEDELLSMANEYNRGGNYDYDTLRHLVSGLETKGSKKAKSEADLLRQSMKSRGDNVPFKDDEKTFNAYLKSQYYDGLDFGIARVRFGDKPKQVMEIRIRDMIK